MITVGDETPESMIKDKKYYRYSDIDFNEKTGLADTKDFRPLPFDLVYLKIKRGPVYRGWWTGQKWYALRLRQNDEVTGWRKVEDIL